LIATVGNDHYSHDPVLYTGSSSHIPDLII
jgi:hypothetical protein